MTQRNRWAAVLAPIGEPSITNYVIDPECVFTVRDAAPLIGLNGGPIGEVTGAQVVDGHLVVTGTLYPDVTIPDAIPTFEVGHNDARELSQVDGEETVTFKTMTITCVRTEFVPAWPGPRIAFFLDWAIHVQGPDDLIPMPDYDTAVRSAERFNAWCKECRRRRGENDYVELPDMLAIVCPWTYDQNDPDDHAAALADLRTYDPDGWLVDDSPESSSTPQADEDAAVCLSEVLGADDYL